MGVCAGAPRARGPLCFHADGGSAEGHHVDRRVQGTDEALAAFLGQLLGGALPAALQLDVPEAAAKRSSSAIRERLPRFEAFRKGGFRPRPFPR